MVNGETGSNGLDAPRHVDLGQEAGQETVIIQLQLMGAKTVLDPTLRQEFVTQMLVQEVQVLIFVKLLRDTYRLF